MIDNRRSTISAPVLRYSLQVTHDDDFMTHPAVEQEEVPINVICVSG